jgi:hypothetical protein
MLQLILAGTGFVLWALYIILTYYSKNFSNVDHLESATGYGGYLMSLIFVYGIYKTITLLFWNKKELRFSFWHIAGFFLIHLFLLTVIYTWLDSVQASPLLGEMKPQSLTLFFHIISLLLYPVALVFIVRSVGASILGKLINGWENEYLRLRVPVDIALGFFVFTTGLLILGSIGAYTLTGLLILLGILIIIAIPGFMTTYRDIQKARAVFENHTLSGNLLEAVNPRLLSAEFAFLIISFLIGVSLISALRPMPIGWDDLGVYMNFPKIMAMEGEYLKWAWMYAWQLITGTGFLFSYTAAQAFYVNQLGGILVMIVIISALSLIFEDSKRKYLLSLPILFAAVFYAMPMNIFQQAKDMKLDPALLAVSITGFMMLFSGWNERNTKTKNLLILLIGGLIIGFAFSIKFTSLMLIMAGFGLIAYRILSLPGFIGFFLLFLAIFTKAGFWAQLNVWMPTDNPALINTISFWLGILALASFVIAWKHTSQKHIHDWLITSAVFLLGILMGISPWIGKNSSEVFSESPAEINKTVVMTSVLGWSGGSFRVDYTQLYSAEEYEERTRNSPLGITSHGQSDNEDLWRYFGYDKGINNYLKLPANLTFQKNQWGEFTDITYIFLALVPSILLFVRGRKGIFASTTAVILILFFSYYFTKGGGTFFTNLFSLGWENIQNLIGQSNVLLIGYGILVAMTVSFLIFAHYSIDKTRDENKRLLEILMSLGVYGFIFLISAFGIVWYGILVYFLFFALIGLASASFTSYTHEEKNDEELFTVKVTLSIIFFILISVYFLRSAFPHGWNNLKEASYNEFKYNILSQEESIFAYRQDYITPIATMNVKDPQALIQRVKSLATDEKFKKFLTSEQLNSISMRDFVSVLFTLSRGKDTAIAQDAKRVGDVLYKAILYPSTEDTNTWGIYRIGTFMTYLIAQNRERYFDDSLVFQFETYFYDKNPELTIDRMKKLGLKYLLVDLNAATIDKDPRHALTTRFEHLLHTMKAKNLTLVDTDNVCLQLALDEYKKWKLQDENSFIDIAGTNYESYRSQSGQTTMIYRGQKQQNCYNYILKLLYVENGSTEYPYLARVKQAIDENGAIGTNGQIDQQKLMNIFSQYIGQSWFALFEISDIPVDITPPLPETIPVTATGTTNTGTVQ